VSSDNSLDVSEKCPICLATFAAQEVGTPDVCDHLFCRRCLLAWSANANTCPVDRKEFSTILVRHNPDGEVIRRISVGSRLPRSGYEAVSLPDMRPCELCGESNGRGDRLAYCYTCNFIFHPECVSSRDTVTLDGWLCPNCFRISRVFHVESNS
jgi:PHD and RING finger domain-containing protein 1